MDIGIIFGQMLILLAMMLCGAFAYKLKWIGEEGSANISKIVVNIFNPMLVLSGVMGDTSAISNEKMIGNAELIAIYYVVVIAFGLILPWIIRAPKRLHSIYVLMTTFSNLGFMGIPVARGLYGDEGVVYVALYVLVYNIFVYTYGMSLARRAACEKNGIMKQEKEPLFVTLKRVINPGVVTALLALVIFMKKVTFPQPIVTFCSYMGDTTIPLSMMMIGISIAKADLKSYLKDARMYLFILLRMVALPIIVALLMKNMGFDAVVFGVFIIELSMPVGSVIGLFAKECGADDAYCMKGSVLSTLASIITIPIVGLFL